LSNVVQSLADPRAAGRRRIAYVHDTNVFGGMETLLLSMLQHLDLARYEPHVLVPGYRDRWRQSPPRLLQLLGEAGVPVLRPSAPPRVPAIGALVDVFNIAATLRRARIEIVHVHTRHPEAARRATLSAWLARVAGILRTEHLPPGPHVGRFTRYSVVPFDAMTDVIFTDSDSDRLEQIRVVGRCPGKLVRSYCGIDAARYAPDHDVAEAKRKLGFDPAVPLVGAIGRLHVQKGHTFLIDAAARVLRESGPVRYVLVGSGPLQQELQASVERLGIADRFSFAGFQADYIAYMQALDIAVMPSLWEGFSIAMQEFMALAKPLVVTDHPSFLEAIRHEQHGLVVPRGDSGALAAAIESLLRDPPLAHRLGRAARQRVLSDFGIEHHMRQLMDHYERLLRQRRP